MTYLEVIQRANNVNLNEYQPLWINGERVGLIWQKNISLLRHYGLALQPSTKGLIWHDYKNLEHNTQYLADICQHMAQDGYISGWRNELFPLTSHFHHPPYALVERASLPYFGACGYGIHVNGLTKKNGSTYMWIAKRSLDKPTDPGKLDQIAAGGIPYGLSAFDNMIKECDEEAGIPKNLCDKAQSVGVVSYLKQTDIGIRADVMFNYDLWLPSEFQPYNKDAEVAEFICLPIPDVMGLILKTEQVKFNSALVMIDCFIRHGFITPEHPDFQQICSGLTKRDTILATWFKQ